MSKLIQYSVRTDLGPPFTTVSEDSNAVVQDIQEEFAKEGGDLVIKALHQILGTDDVWLLSPGYAALKPSLPDYVHVAGKPAHQPLIRSGQHIYNAIITVATANGFAVFADPSLSGDNTGIGIGVAEFWEEKAQYLEKALALVEELLPELYAEIAMRRLGLT